MKLSSIIKITEELISALTADSQSNKYDISAFSSADFFRERKFLGSKDRKIISELTFVYLKIEGRLDLICDLLSIQSRELSTKIAILFLMLNFSKESNIKDLTKNMNLNDRKIYEEISIFFTNDYGLTFDIFLNWCNNLLISKKELETQAKAALESNRIEEKDFLFLLKYFTIHMQLIISLLEQYDAKFLFHFLSAMEHNPPLSIRLNSLKYDYSKAISHLQNIDNFTSKGSISPYALKLSKRTNLLNDTFFKAGYYEIQDEGSQIVSYILDPSQNEIILDACAGAGGKSIHIAALQNDQGEIIATDTNLQKLKTLGSRAKRATIKSIRTKLIKNMNDKELFDKQFDRILIDAPCSGTGTIRRDPLIKWKFANSQINKLTSKQIEILNFYSKFLKKGGILVYATCSFLIEENERISELFLEQNPNFRKEPVEEAILKHKLNIKASSINEVKLNPYEHDSDAFYIAKFKKLS